MKRYWSPPRFNYSLNIGDDLYLDDVSALEIYPMAEAFGWFDSNQNRRQRQRTDNNGNDGIDGVAQIRQRPIIPPIQRPLPQDLLDQIRQTPPRLQRPLPQHVLDQIRQTPPRMWLPPGQREETIEFEPILPNDPLFQPTPSSNFNNQSLESIDSSNFSPAPNPIYFTPERPTYRTTPRAAGARATPVTPSPRQTRMTVITPVTPDTPRAAKLRARKRQIEREFWFSP